ncbi:MAG: hypothetical protein AAF211_04065 [Myxococcota bacterium]
MHAQGGEVGLGIFDWDERRSEMVTVGAYEMGKFKARDVETLTKSVSRTLAIDELADPVLDVNVYVRSVLITVGRVKERTMERVVDRVSTASLHVARGGSVDTLPAVPSGVAHDPAQAALGLPDRQRPPRRVRLGVLPRQPVAQRFSKASRTESCRPSAKSDPDAEEPMRSWPVLLTLLACGGTADPDVPTAPEPAEDSPVFPGCTGLYTADQCACIDTAAEELLDPQFFAHLVASQGLDEAAAEADAASRSDTELASFSALLEALPTLCALPAQG